jgi:hypothetical protein
MVPNSARFWKVRPMPSAAMPWAGVSSSERPSNWMLPSEKLYRRERQLNSVVLPAPLGPIRPTMWPCGTEKETLSSAVMPPKRTLTPSTRSRSARLAGEAMIDSFHDGGRGGAAWLKQAPSGAGR